MLPCSGARAAGWGPGFGAEARLGAVCPRPAAAGGAGGPRLLPGVRRDLTASAEKRKTPGSGGFAKVELEGAWATPSNHGWGLDEQRCGPTVSAEAARPAPG